MATLDQLKSMLGEAVPPDATQPLSDEEYRAGFATFDADSIQQTYKQFIIPQLCGLLKPIVSGRARISVLEIGPGPKSVVGSLPQPLRRKIRKYVAHEPDDVYRGQLHEWLSGTSGNDPVFPCLEFPAILHPDRFTPGHGHVAETSDEEKFDVILFCHSLYGNNPKHSYVMRALSLLAEQPAAGLVVVFHRDGSLKLDGLACHRTASFPDSVTRVLNDDSVLESFSTFVAGCAIHESRAALVAERVKTCRNLATYDESYPHHLIFSSPELMVAFTNQATAVEELIDQLPLATSNRTVKNRRAQRHEPASIVRPQNIGQLQHCVRWAIKNRTSLTIVGGGHSGHCFWRNVTAIDMSAFKGVHICNAPKAEGKVKREDSDEDGIAHLVVVGAGNTAEDVVREASRSDLAVPAGSRPSVGAGLWLQGGLGHLSRLHGLTCDSIVGAVMVTVDAGQAVCVGEVPSQCRPANAVRPDNEAELLWAIRGAGTNFGVVVSLIFKAYQDPVWVVRNWTIPLNSGDEARRRIRDLDAFVARRLPNTASADAYLFSNIGQLTLGVVFFETPEAVMTDAKQPLREYFGTESSASMVHSPDLFDADICLSYLHSGYGSGKTSSFKRCIFIRDIATSNVADLLVTAMENRPSPLSYLHLLQGGGVIRDTPDGASAFGCRDWGFACIITGVWSRDEDGTEAEKAATRWVYDVCESLLPVCVGTYSADLGPDPRDADLAARAFGPNVSRIARLKLQSDPHHVLAYTCPFIGAVLGPKIVIAITGDHGAGKDTCADIWASTLMKQRVIGRVASISDVTKQEYAEAYDIDLNRLLHEREFKEQHREKLAQFFQEQVRQRPKLPEEHFINLVKSAGDVDVLLITGMRDKALVATLGRVVPSCKLLDVRVVASAATRRNRRWADGNVCTDIKPGERDDDCLTSYTERDVDYQPSFTFDNEAPGREAAEQFAQSHLLPLFHEDLRQLSDMVRSVPGFPNVSIDFRHVLGISEIKNGLRMCTALLDSHFHGNWDKVDAIVACEADGFIYASALAERVGVRLALVRKKGTLPPPIISVIKSPSHMSTLTSSSKQESSFEIGAHVVSTGASVVVVDDVLASGETLCAVLELLKRAEVRLNDISILVVAEFPLHGGRQFLREKGFGSVHLQSLLVFDRA